MVKQRRSVIDLDLLTGIASTVFPCAALALELGFNWLRDAGKAKIAQAVVEQRVDVMIVGAPQNQQSRERRREQFQSAAAHFGRELPERQQQASLILPCHNSGSMARTRCG
jgi:hypothetical protein